jgi:hypothetical protein
MSKVVDMSDLPPIPKKSSDSFYLKPRCYESHPSITFGSGVFYGGSCITPIVDDADIYVGLDSGMSRSRSKFPWETEEVSPIDIYFPIVDQSVPKKEDLANFKKLVSWLLEQLAEGKKVHAGCIGGHGRTGLLLAAMIREYSDDEDAITWVRQNYCKKAVESESQVDFLHTHFGVKKVKANKVSYSKGNQYDFFPARDGFTMDSYKTRNSGRNDSYYDKTPYYKASRPDNTSVRKTVVPIDLTQSIWSKII